MSFLFSADYYEVRKNGISPAQNMAAYLGGSAIQTVGDNPVTAYRQLVQQYAKGLDGQAVDPKVATSEANAVFMKNPFTASMSGLWPRPRRSSRRRSSTRSGWLRSSNAPT